MVKVLELLEEDVPRFTKVFICARDIFGDFTGEYYKVLVDQEERLLHVVEDEQGYIYTLYILNEDGTISYDMFVSDKDFNVTQIGYDDFEYMKQEEQTVLKYREREDSEALIVRKREVEDLDGNDGVIIYAQYNGDKDERVYFTFNQRHIPTNNRVYDGRIKNPSTIWFEENVLKSQEKGKKCKSRQYISYELPNGELFFSRILFVDSKGNAITGYPFCKKYSLEELEKMVKDKGFKSYVPKDIIDIHNGEDLKMRLCKDIALLIKDIKKNYCDCKRLDLELGFWGDEDDENN